MSERAQNVPYTPYPTVESSGGGGTPMSVRATPQDFGGQIGGVVEKAGNAEFEIAQKQQGMINDTAMTRADADFATKVGTLKGQYTSLTGSAAYAAFPQYQESIKQAFQEARATLPPAAQRGFDMMAARTMANHIADGSSYASGQLKEANRDSYTSLANAQFKALLDPDVAADPERSQYHLDSLKYAAQAQLDDDHPGLKKDPETGAVSFDESRLEGQNLKAAFERNVEAYTTQGQMNRFQTLANQNVMGAYNTYKQERETMPRSAQVSLDAYFEPKVFNEHVKNSTGITLNEADQGHYQALTNPKPDTASAAISWTMQHEGGFVPNDSGKGPTNFGINQEANPDVDIANLTKSQAANIMHDRYWLGIGADKMEPQMASVAFDTAVNMGVGKAQKLVADADDDPQKLIDLRRAEYQRLAVNNPEKYGKYLDAWNNRLDDLQNTLGNQPTQQKPYGTNPEGGLLSKADYYMLHREDILAKGDAYADQLAPGDLALRRAVRQSLNNAMETAIQNQHAQYTMDNRTIVRAISGELTKGQSPSTYEELRTIPGVAPVLDRVAWQDPKFSEGIPTQIARMARKGDTSNSPNGYETILRTLEPNDQDHPNRIASQDHLDRLLGRSDGTGINIKDYQDAKQVIEASSELKKTISKNMQEITNANGNLDGKGQERALAWYNQVMAARKANDVLGDKKLSDSQFIASIGEKDGPPMPAPPSRMQQIQNWASSLLKSKQDIPTLTDKSQFDALPSGAIYIRDGQQYRKP